MGLQIVTGGAGFIGSHVVERLLGDGERVIVVDDFSSGRETNIEGLRGCQNLQVERASILDVEILSRLFRGAEFVFHLAAVPSVQKSLENPLKSNNANIAGTLAVLLAARDAGVKRVVYASSSSVYGDSETLPKRENFPAQPLSPYALQKYVGEMYARMFYDLFGTGSASLRYFNVFGPRQDPTSEYAAVIPCFITAMLQGRSPVIYGDGEQSRDFTYVENVVEANILAARSHGAAGQVMNIALGERISLNQLDALLNKILGTRIRPVYEAPRAGDVRHSQAAIEQAQQLIGFRPSIDFRTGLERTIDWYKKN
jgi:UDP-glucose 4-epimerase